MAFCCAMRAVFAGVIAGSLISAWAVRFAKVYLFEITPYDPRFGPPRSEP
jgi:hypothetical protein